MCVCVCFTGRDCPGDYKTLSSEARSLTNLLEDIHDKYAKIPRAKQQQLVDACAPCVELLQELDALLRHYNGLDTKSKRVWDRVKHDPQRLRQLRERLVASVALLNAFYTSLMHDGQVRILEALERLERDYRGGHREESIASIGRLTSVTVLEDDGDDDETDDEAWRQILRDLEDVGVTQQQALCYRHVIVDWLVAAVNEGRLLEERPQHDAFSSASQDLGVVLAESEVRQPSNYLEVPRIVSPAPSQTQLSIRSLPTSRAQSLKSVSVTSLRADSDAASLYAEPQRSLVTSHSVSSHGDAIPSVPVPRTHSVVQTVAGKDTTLITSPAAPVEPDMDAPPSYFEQEDSITIDLNWTAQQAVAAWARHDFTAAARLLEDQLAAVERGQRCTSGTQPDRRILKHLLGVCASLTGDFAKAKSLFEKVFNGVFLNQQNLDEGDIAAARWLGDVCLHNQEHANAILAYSAAYEGSRARFGVMSDRTRRVALEIKLLDHWLSVFQRIEGTLGHNVDPTTIFPSANVIAKHKLLDNVRKAIYTDPEYADSTPPSIPPWVRPSFEIAPRPRYDFKLSEGFLLSPLISLSTWPIPWDPLFSPMDAVQLDRYMSSSRVGSTQTTLGNVWPLCDRPLPTNSLGESKKLHFLTRRGRKWLIGAVERGLADVGIEHAAHCFEPAIVCRLKQQQQGVVFAEGVEIRFSKLPFRDVYGIKVSGVRWATRRVRSLAAAATKTTTRDGARHAQDTSSFREIVKGILERAEAEAGRK